MKKLLSISGLLVICAITYAQIPIIAHRGASYLAPENTLASVKLGWELNADAVEIDIYLSKDNRIMVIHDPNTKRTSGQSYDVKETHSKVLRTLDVGSYKDEKYKGEKIPFLEEVIKIIPPGQELVVELKSRSEILPYLKKSIKKYGKNKRFQFICFGLQAILDTKKTFPDNPCYWLCNDLELLKKNINTVAEAGLEGVSLKNTIIDEEVISLAKSLNLEVWAYTVDDPDEARRLINLGITGLTTNRPGWLREKIENTREY